MDVYPHPVPTAWKCLAILRRDNPSITLLECGKQLGVSQNTVMFWLRKPLYQSYETWLINKTYETLPLEAKRSHAEVKQELDEFAVEMLARLRELVETTNDDKLLASVAWDALDRAGYEPAKKDSARPINVILTPETLAMLARRSAEMSDTNVVVGEIVGHTQ